MPYLLMILGFLCMIFLGAFLDELGIMATWVFVGLIAIAFGCYVWISTNGLKD